MSFQDSNMKVFFYLYLFLLLVIRLVVKLFEEEEEHYSMHSNPPDKGTRIVAVDEEKLEGMDHNSYELNLETQIWSV